MDIPLGTSSSFWYTISDAVNVQESHTNRISESWRRFPFVARSARVAPKNWVSSPQSISKFTLTLSPSWFHFAGKYTLIWANTTRACKISQTSVVSVVYKRNLRSVLWSPRRREKSEICANNTFNKHQHHQGTKTTNIWRIVCPLYRGYEIVWMKEVIMLTFSQRIKEWNVCDDPWNWLPSDFKHEMFSNFRVLQFYNLSTDWRFSWARRHFAPRTFCPTDKMPQDKMPQGHFAPGHFAPNRTKFWKVDILPQL